MSKFRILLVLLLLSGVAHAGTISVAAFSADSGLPHLESFRTTVVNVINGNISGQAGTGSTINILADSVDEGDMADGANPRIRANEILGIGVDTTSSATAVVTSGLIPADSANLTSDISAGTAYINGYRVSKSATSHTYTASKDTWVDLDQNGNYTFSEVAVGASEPSVATNSARIAKVTTDGTEITAVTDEANRRLASLIIPVNHRVGYYVSRDSATTMKVFPGSLEVNNTMLSNTSAQTLTLTTAGNWAGGSSLQATSTYGYVGVDDDGNIKMHTTAPTHDNYAVSTTTGKKRYATWSSTVYRIIGWFYMNATGSGELNTYEVGNIKEGDVSNFNVLTSDTLFSTTSATMASDTQAVMRFYSSGGPVKVKYHTVGVQGGGSIFKQQVSVDSAGISSFESWYVNGATDQSAMYGHDVNYENKYLAQGPHTIQGVIASGSGTNYVNRRSLHVVEE